MTFEADVYGKQRILHSRIARVFFDEQGQPRWNQMFTWEAIAERAGYKVPEIDPADPLYSKAVKWYLGSKVKRAIQKCRAKSFDKFKVQVTGAKYIWTLPCFVSVKKKRAVYGFTTNETWIFYQEHEKVRRSIKNLETTLRHWKAYRKLFTEAGYQTQIENGDRLIEEARQNLAERVVQQQMLEMDIAARTKSPA